MPKNRFSSIFAVAAVVSLAACGGGETPQTEIVTDTTAPAPANPLPEGATGTTTIDTTAVPGAGAESSSVELSTRP